MYQYHRRAVAADHIVQFDVIDLDHFARKGVLVEIRVFERIAVLVLLVLILVFVFVGRSGACHVGGSSQAERTKYTDRLQCSPPAHSIFAREILRYG